MKGFEDLEEEFGREVDYDRRHSGGNVRRKRRNERREQVRRQKRGIAAVILVFVLLLIMGGLGFYAIKNELFDFSKDADMAGILGIEGDEVGLFLDGEYLEERGWKSDGEIWLSLDFGRQFLRNLYYDKNEELLLNTTYRGTESWTKDEALRERDGVMFLKLDIIKETPGLSVTEYDTPERLFLNTVEPSETEISRAARLRTEPQDKAEVISKLEEGDMVRLYKRDREWSRVESDGFVGYVKTEALADSGTGEDAMQLSAGAEEVSVEADETEDFSFLTYEGKVIMGFHQVTNPDANARISDVLAASPGINVIAPTWFSLSGMSFTSLSDPEYVAAAHEAGVRVWIVADNFNDPSFFPSTDTENILGWTTRRTALVSELVRSASEVGADGINIDFEQIPSEQGEDFAQFIRELSLESHRAGLVLSVDNYVPRVYSEHYRRDVQAEFADYVVIMSYDENISEIGPNASIDFVEEGITATIQDVPKEHVINALPFYTRIWQQKGAETMNTAAGMNEARNFVSERGGSFTWSDANGCNYAEFESGGAKYYVWLEDDASLETKLKVMDVQGIAGAGFWKLGMEDSGAWDVISRYAAGTL
ncbi:MAG: SH3 domain-containing protein [Lachnospiraceae bacterium]|nr:SH3 domain-containing protein [Lachnospiraceae bacterium]